MEKSILRLPLLIWLLLIFDLQTYGQVIDCQNIGFDEGTTRGWLLTNGSVTDINQQTVFQDEVIGTFENGHRVTSVSDGNDPLITTEAIPMVAPGSSHSLRIGNVTRGSRFDRIRGSFVVTADNTLFLYQFAVILENPAHQPYQQPGFTIRITNQAGTTLSCSEYDVTASANISGFKAQGDYRYRNWTTGAIDLLAYLGQTVTVEVTAHGCTEKKHVGYVYFDAQCLKSEVTSLLYCPGIDKTMTLKAPDGFASYTWNTGQTTASIQITPNQGDHYQVTVTPYSTLTTACQLRLSYVVNVTKPVVPTQQTASICEGDSYPVGDSTYRVAGTYLTRIKRGTLQCDSLVQTLLTLRPLARSTRSLTICEGDSIQVGTTFYHTSGSYTQRISRTASLCDSLVITHLTVTPFSLSLSPSLLIRPGDSTPLQAVVSPDAGDIRYTWTPAESLSCPTCAITEAKPSETTQYTLLAENTTLGCQRTGSVVVSIGSCIIFAPDAFTPNQDGVNDVFLIPANACIQQINELIIYDRWGEIIYQRRNVAAGDAGAGWDGHYKGLLSEAGVYPYILEVTFMTGTISQYRGRVLLIR